MDKQTNNIGVTHKKKTNETKQKHKSEKKREQQDENIDIQYINGRINREVCYETINKLTDTNLLDEYMKCESVNNAIDKLTKILDKYEIETDKKKRILNDYILELIPAGTKGAKRGNKFNNIVKEIINNLSLDNERFEICFEKQCEQCQTTEIPDWYIYDKRDDKVMIGMNQLDLWDGGQQINRGSKYLINNINNTEKSKLLCVVCNYIQFASNKNKAYKLFEIGFRNDTLCYIKNIETIIKKYFLV